MSLQHYIKHSAISLSVIHRKRVGSNNNIKNKKKSQRKEWETKWCNSVTDFLRTPKIQREKSIEAKIDTGSIEERQRMERDAEEY